VLGVVDGGQLSVAQRVHVEHRSHELQRHAHAVHDARVAICVRDATGLHLELSEGGTL
jgi:hypothetical protein